MTEAETLALIAVGGQVWDRQVAMELAEQHGVPWDEAFYTNPERFIPDPDEA